MVRVALYDRGVNPRHRRLIIPAALVALLVIVVVASLVNR
jgi:type II secretory pathway component PulM